MEFINGKEIAQQILNKLDGKGKKLAVILASGDTASQIYVQMKSKQANELGIESIIKKYDSSVSNEEIMFQIQAWNNDESINGILVQIPLFDNLDKNEIVNAIHYTKDVDGLTAWQQGRSSHILKNSIPPATVEAILEAINATTEQNVTWDAITGDDFNLQNNFYTGKNVTIINNSNLIGLPLASILSKCNATVHIVNKFTDDISAYTQQSDIVITATGQTQLYDHAYFKQGTTVIDVTSMKKEEGIVGDVIQSKELEDKLAWLTPVPGGIGPLTIACLLRNVCR